jgi:biopolymer transport protein ExbD
MRRFAEKNAFSTLSEINVTPLLDLAFVLLIIFIITTPLMEKSVDLVLPSDKAAQNAVDPQAVQTVTLDRNEVLKLNGAVIALDGLPAALAALKQAKGDAAVVIRSDKDLPVQKLVDVMSAVQRAQISKVGVVTTDKK